MTKLRTIRFFPDPWRPAIYSRGSGQASLIHNRDWPPGLYRHPAGNVLALQIAGNLRRATMSPKAIRDAYWYANPELWNDEAALDVLCRADALVGGRGNLTLAEAERILADPPAIPPVSPLHRA